MSLHSANLRRRMMTVSALSIFVIALEPTIGLAQGTGTKNVPAPERSLEHLTKKKAAALLLAEIGPNTSTDKKVERLIAELLSSDRNRVQAAVTALTMVGKPAVPAIIRRIDDRRDMRVRVIVFENRSPDAFEAVGQYGVFQVVDCLNMVLNDITGEQFGFVDGSIDITPDRPELDVQRAVIIAGWRGFFARNQGTPRAPGKSLPLPEPSQSRPGNKRSG